MNLHYVTARKDKGGQKIETYTKYVSLLSQFLTAA